MPRTTGLPGLRILVVEDDYFIADQARKAIQAAGGVVDIVGTERAALAEMQNQLPAAALLDISLRETPSYDLARTLRSMGIPFAFFTAYDSAAIPSEFAAVPILQKPAGDRKIVAAVSDILSKELSDSRPARGRTN